VTKQTKKMGQATETALDSQTSQQKQRVQANKEPQNVTAQADKDTQSVTARCGKEAQNVTADPVSVLPSGTFQYSTQGENQAPSAVISLKQKIDETRGVSGECERLRTTEIKQLCRRYPKALIRELEDGSTIVTFVFEPSDPDWVRKLQHGH